MNILLTVEELAKYLKIKPDTIYKKVRRGELPAIKLGKLVRFPKEAIDAWILEQATRTMKEVRSARDMIEARADEAVIEVRKAAKIASRVVPAVFEEVRKAPLEKKQEALTHGLQTLWKGLAAAANHRANTNRPKRKKAAKPSTKKAKSRVKSRSSATSPKGEATL